MLAYLPSYKGTIAMDYIVGFREIMVLLRKKTFYCRFFFFYHISLYFIQFNQYKSLNSDRVLLPARELTFTSKNILCSWEVVGIIPLNPHWVTKPETRQLAKKISTPAKAITIPETPRAVISATRTALPLIQRDTPHSRQLKVILAGISEGYQDTIADKIISEEAYRQYQEVVGGQKKNRLQTGKNLLKLLWLPLQQL